MYLSQTKSVNLLGCPFRMWKWLQFLVLATVLVGAVSGSKSSTASNESSVPDKGKIYTILGLEFQLPGWIMSVRNFFLEIFEKVQNFLDGKTSFSTTFFGTKMDIKAQIPKSQEEATKSIFEFFAKIKNDPVTRIMFILYLNLVVIFVVYGMLMVYQYKAARQQSRLRQMDKKFKKIEEEEKRSAGLEGPRRGIEVEMQLQNETSPSFRRTQQIDERGSVDVDPSINWTGVVQDSVMNMCDKGTISTKTKMTEPRLLLPDMFSSPVISERDDSDDDNELDKSRIH